MTNSTEVLLTGSHGWIGALVWKSLTDSGYEVTTVSHDMPTNRVIEAARAAKVVVHGGASPFVDRHTLFETGIDQAIAVARGVCGANNNVIMLSSTKVYGSTQYENKLLTEDAKPDPICTYGRAKLVVEELLAAASARCRILRISNVVGPNIPAHFLLGALLKKARSSGELTFTCDGNSCRDFVNLHDVVGAIVRCVELACCEQQPVGKDVVNIVSGESVSFRDLAGIFMTILSVQSKYLGSSPTIVPKISNKKAYKLGLLINSSRPIDMIHECVIHEWSRLEAP